MWPFYLASAVSGYLLGSFPTGYLVGRAYGLDIRQHGSGNIGATNVVRVLGKRPGYLVFACDTLKGLLAVGLTRWFMQWLVWRNALQVLGSSGIADPNSIYPSAEEFQSYLNGIAIPAAILAALGCILGHNFPVWLGFRGGKGVATTVGVLLGLMPEALGVTVVVWVASFFLLRYVSLASMLGALALPIAVWFFSTRRDLIGGPAANPLFWFSVVAALLIFWRHRSNVQRLLNGTEPRFSGKKPVPPPAP